MSWRSFFAADAGPLQHELVGRLLGTQGEPAASRGELSGLDDPSWLDDRPAMLSLPMPLVHPGFRATLSGLLGLTEEEVQSVARYDTCLIGGRLASDDEMSSLDPAVIWAQGGGQGLARRLAELGHDQAPGLMGLFEVLPIEPPSSRPPVESDARVLLPSSIGFAYARLVDALASARSRAELAAPLSMRWVAWESVQDAFDALCTAARGEASTYVRELDAAWGERTAESLAAETGGDLDTGRKTVDEFATPSLTPSPPIVKPTGVDSLLEPIGIAFLDADTLLLRFPLACAAISLADGRPRWLSRTAEASIWGVLPGGGRALFVERVHLIPRLALLDLRTGAFSGDDEGLPRFPFAAYQHDEWEVWDCAHRRVLGLRRVDNERGGVIVSPCWRYAWIEEDSAIVRLSDLAPQVVLTGAQLGDSDDDNAGDPRMAIVCSEGTFLWFHRGSVYQRGEAILTVEAPYSCAAFSPDAHRLGVGRAREVSLIDLDGQLVRELSLAHLASELSLEDVRDELALDPAIEIELLARFGTRRALAAASPPEICDVGPWDSAIEPELAEALSVRLKARGR